MSAGPLYAFKFIVSTNEWVPDPTEPGLSHKGCLAIAIAPDEDTARRALTRYADEFGQDGRWLRVATVKRLNIDGPAALCWVQL